MIIAAVSLMEIILPQRIRQIDHGAEFPDHILPQQFPAIHLHQYAKPQEIADEHIDRHIVFLLRAEGSKAV